MLFQKNTQMAGFILNSVKLCILHFQPLLVSYVNTIIMTLWL